jgi:hypothetical protein
MMTPIIDGTKKVSGLSVAILLKPKDQRAKIGFRTIPPPKPFPSFVTPKALK